MGSAVKRFTPPDAMAFLLMESTKRPMHMGGLQLFTPPEDAGPGFVRRTHAAMRACEDVAPMFAGHPVIIRGRSVVLRWTYDKEVNLDHHVKYTALPAPGGKSELFQLISRLHGQRLGRHRPLWEVHVIDGLDDGRFAIFTKAHHALFDGVSFLSLLRRSLSTDPHHDRVDVLWSQRPEAGAKSHGDQVAGASWWETPRLIKDAWRERELFPVFRAPKTLFNARSEVPWVCAIQPWPIQRIEDVARAAAVTINDVALAMCAGALRAYLLERDCLPSSPLVGVSPVDLRTARDVEGRNVMSSAVCNLGTHLEDAAERLATIHASMRYNTHLLRRLPRQVSMQLAGVIGVPITDGSGPLQFNVGISHVADSRKTRYHNGARAGGDLRVPADLARTCAEHRIGQQRGQHELRDRRLRRRRARA